MKYKNICLVYKIMHNTTPASSMSLKLLHRALIMRRVLTEPGKKKQKKTLHSFG